MKKLFYLLTAAIIMASMAVLMSACDTDNDDNPPADANIVSIEYVGNLGEAWYKFYDVTVTYTTDEGVKTETYTGPAPFHYVKQNIAMALAPKSYLFKIEVTPKDPMPEYDKVGKYDFSYECAALGVKGNFDQSNPALLFIDNLRQSTFVSGADVETFIQKRNGTIFNFSKGF